MKKHLLWIITTALMICVLTGCNFSKKNGDLQIEEEIEEDIENTQNHGESEKKNENTKDEPAEQPIVTKPVAETPEPQSDKAEELFKYNVISDDYEEVFVNNSYASSQLDIEKEDDKYSTINLFDHDVSTAFAEGAEGNGIGEMIRIHLGEDGSTTTVTKITVRPGYQKSKETFENNSRPTKLEFHFSDGSVVETEFGDDYDENAEFTFNFDPILATDCVMVISDVCTGKKYEDCCISEVAFYSQKTDGMMYYERDLIGQENTDAHFSIEAYANGEMCWSYDAHNPLTELTSGGSYITARDGMVYIHDNGKIVALDGATGEKIWENDMFSGYAGTWAFDKDGNLYLSGYYGPDLIVIDKEGNVLRYEETLTDNTYYWPCMLIVNDNNSTFSIYYDAFDDGSNYFGKIITENTALQ